MWKICNMLWRIGDLLPVRDQIEWCRREGFDGIGLHASPGTPGAWEGIDPASAGQMERKELRRRISRFALCEIHAPFSIVLTRDSLAHALHRLEPVTAFARDIGARVVTVHAELPADGRASTGWRESLARLDAEAAEKGLRIGLEITSGFDQVQEWNLDRIGVTLDVGHMYHMDGGAHLEPFGSIGALVRRIAPVLVHLHLHDVTDLDHVEIGTGRVDFPGLLTALRDIGYSDGLCLELNPDRVPPEGIRRSLAWLRERSRAPEPRP